MSGVIEAVGRAVYEVDFIAAKDKFNTASRRTYIKMLIDVLQTRYDKEVGEDDAYDHGGDPIYEDAPVKSDPPEPT